MSGEQQQDRTSGGEADASREKQGGKPQRGVFLVPYPKIVFFYPSVIAAIVIAVWMFATGRTDVEASDRAAVALTWVFLAVFSLNLCIVAFDFPRATSLTLFFFVAALVLAAVLANMYWPDIFPAAVSQFRKHVRPAANATFYSVFAVVMLLIYGAVLIKVRFNYWEVRPNELLHHHGILSDLERYSAPQLRVEKEINDIFEYLLLRSGRLILHPSGARRSVILENVPFIGRKETEITRMLGALQVRLRTDEH